MYTLGNKEFLKLIFDVHRFMAYTDRFIQNSRGEIESVTDIPENSVVLLFGGMNSPTFNLIEHLYRYKKKFGNYPALIMIGKVANKIDNTAGLGSEVGCCQYILEKCGVSKEIVRKYYIEPEDTSTAENIISLKDILEKYPELNNRKIILATNSVFRRRAVHDFAAGMPDADLATLELPELDFKKSDFYIERADGLIIDVMMGACFYHSMLNKERWLGGEAAPPTDKELEFANSVQDIKGILTKYCGWIYPNNLVDLGIAASLEEGAEIIATRKRELLQNKGATPDGMRKEIDEAIKDYLSKISVS